jgi:oligopeptidase B
VTIPLVLACLFSSIPDQPVAPVIPTEIVAPGGTRVDEYYWLRDRKNPATLEYLEAENAYADSMMRSTAPLRDSLVAEMTARVPAADTSAATLYNGFLYRSRYPEGADYPIYERSADIQGSRWVELLDVSRIAPMYDYLDIPSPAISPDGLTAAFSIDTTGSLEYTIVFESIESGDFLRDTLNGTDGSMVWASDSGTFFYGALDSTWRTDRILRHQLGTAQAEDVVVYQEFDATFWPWVYKSPSDEYVFIGTESSTSTEVWFLDSRDPAGPLTLVQERTPDLEYGVTGIGDTLFIRTNLDAEDFRVMKCAATDPGRDDWIEVVPGRPGFLIEDVEAFPSALALVARENGVMELLVVDRQSLQSDIVAGGDIPCSIWLQGNSEPERDIIRFSLTSLTTPSSVYDLDLSTGEASLVRREPVGGGYDPELYASAVLYAPAPDGERVPISLVWRKDAVGNGPSPLLLYGYGAYGYSNDPWFSPTRLSLLDRGFIFAIAHVRGGSELGRRWYEEGKLLNKRNTFTDFIACAEYLVSEGLTEPRRLFAQGESAGGLLMGAVTTMRPDLFRGVIAGVPFVDVVTTMLDPSIPLTTNEYEEWGNPGDPVYYDYMLSYSPYDNIREADYPAMFVTAGWNDSQVCFWEPAKFVAKMRAMRTDDDLLVFRTNMGAGHGGTSGRYSWLDDVAYEYAFLLELTGRD